MRLDAEHVRKLANAFDGNHVDIDIEFMSTALSRLNMWERGVLFDSVLRAAAAKRKSKEQRVLLALFVNQMGAVDA